VCPKQQREQVLALTSLCPILLRSNNNEPCKGILITIFFRVPRPPSSKNARINCSGLQEHTHQKSRNNSPLVHHMDLFFFRTVSPRLLHLGFFLDCCCCCWVGAVVKIHHLLHCRVRVRATHRGQRGRRGEHRLLRSPKHLPVHSM
jgi:hypothetical protein